VNNSAIYYTFLAFVSLIAYTLPISFFVLFLPEFRIFSRKFKRNKIYKQQTVAIKTPAKVFLDNMSTVIFFIFRVYVLLVAISLFASFLSTDYYSIVKNIDSMNRAGCHSESLYPENVFKIWETYPHYDYWLADYKGHIKVIESERCLHEIVLLLQKNDKKLSAAFTDDEGKVFFILKSGK
jgi:hypothetical protein